MDDMYIKELVPVIKIEYLTDSNSDVFFSEAQEEDEDNLEKFGSAPTKQLQENIKTKLSILQKASKKAKDISASCLWSRKNYICKLCNLFSCDKESIEFHEVHCRKLAIILKDCRQIVDKVKYECFFKDEIRSESYVCNECGKQFIKKKNIITHMKFHVRRCLYFCECGKSFTLKGNLATHMKIHSGERPFACKYCERAFIKNSDLTRHYKTHSEALFTCKNCGKSFRYKYTLDRHMKLHSGERPYKCDQCDKSFVEQVHLIFHLRLHSGERPYACNKCKKSFVRNSDLIKHYKTVHSMDKPYMCERCGKSFPLKYYLGVHLKSHCL